MILHLIPVAGVDIHTHALNRIYCFHNRSLGVHSLEELLGAGGGTGYKYAMI